MNDYNEGKITFRFKNKKESNLYIIQETFGFRIKKGRRTISKIKHLINNFNIYMRSMNL